MRNFSGKRVAVLSVLLLTVLVSSFPVFEIHTHHEVRHGHVHDAYDPGDPEAQDSFGVIHVHEAGATNLTLLSSLNVGIAVLWRVDGVIPFQSAKPPSNVTPPLYRPPIV